MARGSAGTDRPARDLRIFPDREKTKLMIVGTRGMRVEALFLHPIQPEFDKLKICSIADYWMMGYNTTN
jgi:hypothetical protein